MTDRPASLDDLKDSIKEFERDFKRFFAIWWWSAMAFVLVLDIGLSLLLKK